MSSQEHIENFTETDKRIVGDQLTIDFEENLNCDKSDQSWWKNSTRIGHSYQAPIPSGTSPYIDNPPYKDHEKVLWKPDKLSDLEIKKYLIEYSNAVEKSIIGNNHMTMKYREELGMKSREDNDIDNEQALYLLLKYDNNTEKALDQAGRLKRLILKQQTKITHFFERKKHLSSVYSLALRHRKKCSSEERFELKAEELKNKLLDRNYNENVIDAGIERARRVPRSEALKKVG